MKEGREKEKKMVSRRAVGLTSVSFPPGPTAHSQISPVREFNAAITFFSVATTNFLDPGENSKEANLSFPTYCCLLRKGAGEHQGKAITTKRKMAGLTLAHLPHHIQEMCANEEL